MKPTTAAPRSIVRVSVQSSIGRRSLMRITVLALVLAALPAAAQPVLRPTECSVTIARAPDDVRAVVDAWVRSEPRCSIALEVRIVPSEGGLYLLATDERGGIRERLVPDAQTAGVLIASWIADDSATQPQPEPAPAPPAPPVLPARRLNLDDRLAPPGLAPVLNKRVARRHSKWLTVGGMAPLAPNPTMGLRGELDLWTLRGGLSIGMGASYSVSTMTMVGGTMSGDLEAQDGKWIANIAHTSQLGRWQLRPSLGAGLIYTDAMLQLHDLSGGWLDAQRVGGVAPVVEVSVLVTRELGKKWAVYTGPLATLVSQDFEFQMTGSSYTSTAMRNALDLVLFAGVRHRL
jgi:hypothetical protein